MGDIAATLGMGGVGSAEALALAIQEGTIDEAQLFQLGEISGAEVEGEIRDDVGRLVGLYREAPDQAARQKALHDLAALIRRHAEAFKKILGGISSKGFGHTRFAPASVVKEQAREALKKRGRRPRKVQTFSEEPYRPPPTDFLASLDDAILEHCKRGLTPSQITKEEGYTRRAILFRLRAAPDASPLVPFAEKWTERVTDSQIAKALAQKGEIGKAARLLDIESDVIEERLYLLKAHPSWQRGSPLRKFIGWVK